MATFTTTTKQKLSWVAPVGVRTADRFLDIGSGYNLLVATGYKLIIQPGQAGSEWTTISKEKLTF